MLQVIDAQSLAIIHLTGFTHIGQATARITSK
jgi:hypothetical protein